MDTVKNWKEMTFSTHRYKYWDQDYKACHLKEEEVNDMLSNGSIDQWVISLPVQNGWSASVYKYEHWSYHLPPNSFLDLTSSFKLSKQY